MITGAHLAKMKPYATFINTARGPVHDQKALYRALKEGWIAGAGLDVQEQEPIDPNDPILTLDNIVFTPHYASYTEEAYQELNKRLHTSFDNFEQKLAGRMSAVKDPMAA